VAARFAVGMSARLDPENGALVQSAIEAVARAEQLTPAQALTRLAEIALATLAADPDTSPLGLRGHQLAAIQIHVDADHLPAEDLADDEQAAPRSRERGPQRPAGRIVEGPGLPDPVVLRLLCSGRIRTVLLDSDQRPLDLGRRNRVISERQYAALMLRHHRRCAHPGCESRISLEAHHVRHWIHGGRTNLDNLVLCAEPITTLTTTASSASKP
jgi:HNH endonuclease